MTVLNYSFLEHRMFISLGSYREHINRDYIYLDYNPVLFTYYAM